MTRRHLLMRNDQTTPIPPGGNLSRSMMNSSLPALPSIPSDQFYDIMETTNPLTLQVEAVRKGDRLQMHCMDLEVMRTFS